MKYLPAANIYAGAVAGLMVTVLVHVLAKYQIDISQDMADGLTGAAAIGVSHLWDMWTAAKTGKPPQ